MILLLGIISLPTDPVHEGGNFNLVFRLFENVSIEYKVNIMNREIVRLWLGFSAFLIEILGDVLSRTSTIDNLRPASIKVRYSFFI